MAFCWWMLCLSLFFLVCVPLATRLPEDLTGDWKRSLVDVMETSFKVSQPYHRDDRISERPGRIRSGHGDLAPKKAMFDATRSPKLAPDVRRKRVTPHQAKTCAAAYNWKCAKCGKMLGADFQIDHIVPLHLGGEHCISNMQPLHPHCHAKKNSEEQMAARR